MTAVVCEAPPRGADGLAGVFDAEAVGPELTLRLPRPGDRFVPSGMTGRKKLQDYFVDAKVPAAERRPVLVLAVDDIVWVVGHRLAETGRPSAATRRFVVVRVLEQGQPDTAVSPQEEG